MDEQNNAGVPEKKMNMPLVAAGTIVVLILLGLFVFRTSQEGKNAPVNEKRASQSAAKTAVSFPLTKDTVSISVDAGSFFYSIKEIRVKKGQKIKITLSAKDAMHDFVIDEFGVKMPLTKEGQTNAIEFTADKTGVFEYYCSVGQHRKNGQVGKLIVE